MSLLCEQPWKWPSKTLHHGWTLSDERTTNSFSHKKTSFSQNPTAQELNGLEMTIWGQNLETYLFVSGLFALVHRKSSSMTVSTNHDIMTMKDCMEPTGGKSKQNPQTSVTKNPQRLKSQPHIKWDRNLISLQPFRLYSVTFRNIVLL